MSNCSIIINVNGIPLKIGEFFLENNSREEALEKLYNNSDFIQLLKEATLRENNYDDTYKNKFKELTDEEAVDGGLQGNFSLNSFANFMPGKSDNVSLLLRKLSDSNLNLSDFNIYYSEDMKERIIRGKKRNFYILNKNTLSNPKKFQKLLVSLYVVNNGFVNNYEELINNVLTLNNYPNEYVEDIIESIKSISDKNDKFVEFINYSLFNSKFQEYLQENDFYNEFTRLVSEEFNGEYNLEQLEPADYVNYSGGAYGADTYWDLIGRKYGVTKHIHFRTSTEYNLSEKLAKKTKPTILSHSELDEGLLKLKETFPDLNVSIDNVGHRLRARNWFQVKNADSIFAIGTIQSDRKSVNGGTNTAVQMAIQSNKPVYVFDLNTKQWFEFNGSVFTQMSEIPTLTKKFAGIGTRNIENYYRPRGQNNYMGKTMEDAASNAIEAVYQKTLGLSNPPIPTPEIQFNNFNVDKILLGNKTSTIRSRSQAHLIGIPTGETQVRKIGNYLYNVTNRGELTIEEAGGLRRILRSENVASVDDFEYPQTKEWALGKGKRYVYSIKYIESPKSLEFPQGDQQIFNNLTRKDLSKYSDIIENNLYLKILSDIVNGQKFKTVGENSVGLTQALGNTNNRIEQQNRLNLTDNNKGVTLEVYGENLTQQFPMFTSETIFSIVTDILNTVTSPKLALEEITKILRDELPEDSPSMSLRIFKPDAETLILEYKGESIAVRSNAENMYDLIKQVYPKLNVPQVVNSINSLLDPNIDPARVDIFVTMFKCVLNG